MHEIVEGIQNLSTYAAYACAVGVGACVFGVGAFWVARKLVEGKRNLAAVSLVGAMLIGGMVVVGTDDAGSKPGTNVVNQVEGGTNSVGQTDGGTNAWTNVEGTNTVGQTGGDGTNGTGSVAGPLMLGHFGQPNLMQELPSAITDEDIEFGWRIASVSSNVLATATFTMPTNATVWESAQACGRGHGAWHIPLDGWHFTYGDVGWTNGFAWVEGYFRSRFNSRANEIRLLSERLTLCPAANWSRYNLNASRAWCATNGVDGLIVTFEGAAVGDDPTKIASVQMELFPRTGEVALRYDLANVGDATYTAGLVIDGTNRFVEVGAGTREVVFQRVHPNDWDMDGIPNSIDDTPREPSLNIGYNQTDAWAMAAFPSNSAEIATMGYAAWAAARGSETNRLLVALSVASANGAWPVCLTFGDKQVMCDGTAEILFPINRGARYAFSVSGGEVASVSVPGVESRDMTWLEWFHPWDFPIGDVSVHQESASDGWIESQASVVITLDGRGTSDFGQYDDVGGIFGHFKPGETHVLTGEVHQCHSNAFLDCTWSGGPGFAFANPHSLATDVSWTTVDATAWATNFISLVTNYEGGYSLTNVVMACVGPEHVPPTGFSLSCQDILFLNDDRRLERFYAVNVTLEGTNGLSGVVALESSGVGSKLTFDPRMDATTNRIEFAIGVEDGDWFMDGKTVYISCAEIGEGRVDAAIVFTNGTSCATSATFRVIEPLRRLVTSDLVRGQFFNPSCLVHGTNALLKVGMRGELGRTNVVWNILSGPGRFVNRDGFTARVEATATNGTVVVEARFNQDEIQPRFVLPVVMPRELNVKAFVVEPPAKESFDAWSDDDITHQIKVANVIFAQVGIRFNLQSITHNIGTDDDWVLNVVHRMPVTGWEVPTWQVWSLLDTYDAGDCIELYFVGRLSGYKAIGFHTPWGIVITRNSYDFIVAHEIGHALGLHDCYVHREIDGIWGKCTIDLPGGMQPIDADKFADRQHDWQKETGRGFYAREDSWRDVACHFLMHGVPSRFLNVDIPYGKVKAFHRDSSSTNDVEFVSIGVDGLKQADSEVYSK